MIESPVPKSVSDNEANRQNAVFLDGFLLTGNGATEDDSYWAWIATFGLDDPQSPKDADPDGDGQWNYVEMLQGTDPTDPQSRLFITSIKTLEEHNREVTWLSTPGKIYALEFSTNLAAPQWLVLGVVLASPVPRTTTAYLDDQNVSPPVGFYRVRLLEDF